MTEPLRAAIVGAGPSGFYAAGQLLAVDEPSFAVDLYDRLPTPYGLVRSGVAPDHPKIKSVTRAYDKTTEHERFRFFGHVELGGDITRRQLLEHYHVVLYTLGTSIDRRLGIPGEELRGSHAATEFVAWYNGHPDHSGLEVDLQGKHAVVIGAGNVAIDVARMLALAPSELAGTDTADHAIEVLAASGIEDITILARRGPLQAAFTNPELLEMGELERGDVEIVGGELDELSAVALGEADKTRRRNVEILREYEARPKTGKPITVRFRFLASPVELLGDEHGHVRAVRIVNNAIVARDDGSLAARGTGTFDELPAQLVFRSIGYTGPARRRRPVRRAARPDPQRGRSRDRSRRHAPARRVRVRLDQARPVGRDRNEQEGFPGHRHQDRGGRGRRPREPADLRRHRGPRRGVRAGRGDVGGLAGDQRDRDRRRRGLRARAPAREAHRVGGAARSGDRTPSHLT